MALPATPGGATPGRSFGPSVRPPPSRGAIARRRWAVGITKLLLPLLALGLLTLLAFWPEFSRDLDRTRLWLARGAVVPENGLLTEGRYNGTDDHNQPYTLTAATARQIGPDRVDMTLPRADLSLQSGTWVMIQAARGVYVQKSGGLDLEGDVTLYRDDGMTVTTDTATIDVRAGVAVSNDRTHVEGPFGTLDAQGFTITDRGDVIRFYGPGRLHLNGTKQ